MLTDYHEGVERLEHLSVNAARTLGRCQPEGKFWEPLV